MATQTLSEPRISVEQYLATGYQPDCEYNDGVVEERNLGEFDHSFLQTFLGSLFTNKIAAWDVFALTEQRVQIRRNRFLIPDVTVLRMNAPKEDILSHPPLITIEIMSPKDRLRDVAAKSLEYLDFGVENIWVIDPNTRTAYRGTETGLERVGSNVLTVTGTAIEVNVIELFAKLDQIWARRGPASL